MKIKKKRVKCVFQGSDLNNYRDGGAIHIDNKLLGARGKGREGGTDFVRGDGIFSCRHTEFEFSAGHPKVELSSRQPDTQI